MSLPLSSLPYPVQNPRHEQALLDAAGRGLAGTPALTQAAAEAHAGLFGADGLSFKDVVDAVNPLQQLPVVGSIYRAATGDTISALSRIAGGFLLGGPIGAAVAAVNAGFEAITGGDLGEQALALLQGGSTSSATPTQYASVQYMKAKQLG